MHLATHACRFAALAFTVLLSTSVGTFANSGAVDALAKPRLQMMLVDGDTGMIAAIFRRSPGQTLPFIDSYLEGGLAMIEKGDASAMPDAIASFRMGIRFAKIADEAFGGTAFSEYANAFASWSPTEQKSFREGQRLFKVGMKAAKDDPKAAMAALRESLALADSLGDLWGQSMALGALADITLKVGGEGAQDDAFALAERASGVNRKIRLLDDLVQSLRVTAAASNGPVRWARLQEAWEIVRNDANFEPTLRRDVASEYAAALDAEGRANPANAVRRAAALLPAAPDATKGERP